MSSGVQTIGVVFGLPILVFALHELTHWIVARAVSPLSISRESYIPFRLRLDFQQTPSLSAIRIVALAPTLVGGAIAIVTLQTGVWSSVQHLEPYYLHYILGANWLLYTAPSPADLRTAVSPPADDSSTTSAGST